MPVILVLLWPNQEEVQSRQRVRPRQMWRGSSGKALAGGPCMITSSIELKSTGKIASCGFLSDFLVNLFNFFQEKSVFIYLGYSLQILQAIIPLITFFQGWKLYDLKHKEGKEITIELKRIFTLLKHKDYYMMEMTSLTYFYVLLLQAPFFLMFGKLRAINQNGR